jgi:hypothetical protein
MLVPRRREASDQESSHEADEDPSISRDLGAGRRANRLLLLQKEGAGLRSPGAGMPGARGNLSAHGDALLRAHAHHVGAGRHGTNLRGARLLIAPVWTAVSLRSGSTPRGDGPPS